MFNESPGSNNNEEAICSTPPQSAYRISSNNHTPEFDFGRQSPVFMSMTQRAMKLGVDVVWASSPTRRSSSPLIERKMPTPPVGLYAQSPTGIVRRKSIKERKIRYEAQSPKKGIYKFQEDLKSIMPLIPKAPTVTVVQQGESGFGSMDSAQHIVSLNNEASVGVLPVISLTINAPTSPNRWTNKRSGSQATPGTPAKYMKSEQQPKLNQSLSTSICNEFMDDSEFDMVLFQSSQDIENRIKNEEQNGFKKKSQTRKTPRPIPMAKPHLFQDSFPENDSIDEFMSSKELDQLISSQSTVAYVTHTTSKPLMERHRSMPDCSSSLLNISDDILCELSDERLNDLIANSGSGNASSSTRNAQFERHNSMPVSPFANLSKNSALSTKRRLLQSFPKTDQVHIISSDDSDA